MALSKVSKKGLVNIPAEIRRLLSIEEGDYLVCDTDLGRRVLDIIISLPIKIISDRVISTLRYTYQ